MMLIDNIYTAMLTIVVMAMTYYMHHAYVTKQDIEDIITERLTKDEKQYDLKISMAK